jgi:tetratricopeptide (TPR) repeat protein
LEASLRAAPDGAVKSRCRALHYIVQAYRNQFNWVPYLVYLEQLESLAREHQLPEFQAIVLDQRMWDKVKNGDNEGALELCESIVKLRQFCVEQAQSQSLDPNELEKCRLELNDAMILQVEILAKAGRIDEAWRLMEESLALKRASRDESGLTFGLNKYAQLLAETGRFADARPVFEEVVRRTEESGDRSVVLGWYRHDAAKMALHAGDLERGRELIGASYAVFKENGASQGFLLSLQILAYYHGLKENWRLVARTLGAGDAARGASYPDDWQAILEAQEKVARAALGDGEFELQRAEGARLAPEQAIEAAL